MKTLQYKNSEGKWVSLPSVQAYPSGGEEGQVLTKTEGGVEWKDIEVTETTEFEEMTDDEVDALFEEKYEWYAFGAYFDQLKPPMGKVYANKIEVPYAIKYEDGYYEGYQGWYIQCDADTDYQDRWALVTRYTWDKGMTAEEAEKKTKEKITTHIESKNLNKPIEFKKVSYEELSSIASSIPVESWKYTN